MSGVVPGEYIIALEEGVVPAEFIRGFGPGLNKKHVFSRALNGFSAELTPEAAERMRNNPLVKHLDPNPIPDAGYSPITDTYPGWALERIFSPAAGAVAIADKQYEYSWGKDGAGTNIYIIDHGYPRDHIEFEGVYRREGYIPPGTIAADYLSHHAHATSSCVGGRYSGIAKRASIIWSVAPTGTDTIAACDWIMANHPGGPGVCNMSLGFYNDDDSPLHVPTVDEAIQNLINFGILFCCSAGNQSYESGSHTPTTVADALVCGSLTEWMKRASSSCWGAAVDIWAPGNSVKVASPDSYTTYTVTSGTSYSAAFTSGTAAVIWAENPTWTRQQVVDEIINRSIKDVMLEMDITDNNRILYSGPQTAGQIHSEYMLVPIEILPIINAVGSSTMTASSSVVAFGSTSANVTSSVEVIGSHNIFESSHMAATADLGVEYVAFTPGHAVARASAAMNVSGGREVYGAGSMMTSSTFEVTEQAQILAAAQANMFASGRAVSGGTILASGTSGLYTYIGDTLRGVVALRGTSTTNIVTASRGENHSEMDAVATMTVSGAIAEKSIVISIVDISKPTVLSENSDVVLAQWQIRKTGIKGKGVTV